MRLGDTDWRALLHARAREPEAVADAYARRRRPERSLHDRDRVFLVAADHPARGALRSGDDPLAMAHRRHLLDRLTIALAHPDVDGVLGSPDVVEELLLLGALEDKLVLGSMNRGGLDGARWTMDDRFTGYDAAAIDECRLDGGKMLLRIDDGDPAVAATIESCARAVSELAARKSVAMIEPLPYRRVDGRFVPLRDTASLARAISVASGLGTTSAYTWLKTPACDDPEGVYAATTLPCVVLGGPPSAGMQEHVTSLIPTLQQPVVRGLVIGRTVLFPEDGNVARSVQAAAHALRAATLAGVDGGAR